MFSDICDDLFVYDSIKNLNNFFCNFNTARNTEQIILCKKGQLDLFCTLFFVILRCFLCTFGNGDMVNGLKVSNSDCFFLWS